MLLAAGIDRPKRQPSSCWGSPQASHPARLGPQTLQQQQQLWPLTLLRPLPWLVQSSSSMICRKLPIARSSNQR